METLALYVIKCFAKTVSHNNNKKEILYSDKTSVLGDSVS